MISIEPKVRISAVLRGEFHASDEAGKFRYRMTKSKDDTHQYQVGDSVNITKDTGRNLWIIKPFSPPPHTGSV
jgi:hypothetical protein